MPVCPTCNAELDANARFCPKDGTTIRSDTVLAPLSGESSSGNNGPLFDSGRAETVRARAAAPADASDRWTGRLLDGRYRIKKRLGEGGVGAVYEAEHEQMKKVVAVKVLHPIYSSSDEFRKRFEREARAASRLSHPACVQVTDFGLVGKVAPPDEKLIGTPYLVMEFVRGTVLLDRLLEGPKLTPHEAVAIVRELLGALKHAHAMGIVHRDLKPANVMLLSSSDERSPRVKLLDFGLAKELLADTNEAPLTQAGMVFGTPGYLSPEQAAGKPLDARTDLYSLGVILFELCTDRRLFPHKDPIDMVRDHLNTRPDDPRSVRPALSPALSRVILKALEKDPAQRWASADELAAALAAVPEAGAPVAKSPWKQLLERRVAGRPAWQLGAAGGGLLLLAVVALSLRGSPPPKKTVAPPPRAPVAAAPAPSNGPISDGARYAFDLVKNDRADEALKVARDALRDDPRDGWAHAALASAYARKMWCSDALEELDKAVRDRPQLHSRAELAHPAISCLTPRTWARASRFLVEKMGPDARAPLETAAANEPNLEVRKNAQKLLERLPP